MDYGEPTDHVFPVKTAPADSPQQIKSRVEVEAQFGGGLNLLVQ